MKMYFFDSELIPWVGALQLRKSYWCGSGRKLLKVLLQALACLMLNVLLFGSRQAMATVDCTVADMGAAVIAMPPSITISVRDYVGDPVAISGWAVSSGGSWFTCDMSGGNGLEWAAGVGLKSTLQATGASLDGFPIYKTDRQNIGVQVNWVANVGGCTGMDTTWRDIYQTAPASYLLNPPAPYVGWSCQEAADKYSLQYSMQVRARWVQLGPVTAGTVTVSNVADGNGFRTTTASRTCGSCADGPLSLIPGLPTKSYSLTPTNIVTPTCTVSVQDVQLDSIDVNVMNVSQTAGNKNFQFLLSGCPAGIGSLTYKLDAVGNALYNAGNGIMNNTTGGDMATGVGLQVTDASSQPVKLDGTVYPVPGYNSALGGNTTIPMKVSYYKTGTVSAGLVRGVAALTLYYR